MLSFRRDADPSSLDLMRDGVRIGYQDFIIPWNQHKLDLKKVVGKPLMAYIGRTILLKLIVKLSLTQCHSIICGSLNKTTNIRMTPIRNKY